MSRISPDISLFFLRLLMITAASITNLALSEVAADEAAAKLLVTPDPKIVSETAYKMSIEGQVIIPDANGDRKLPLVSNGTFKFQQRQFLNGDANPNSLRAIRQFSLAGTTTKVGSDHVTKVSLSPEFQTLHAFGDDNRLLFVSPRYLIPRRQLDLLQLPFDPLVLNSTLPTGEVKVDDKWNTDFWQVPLLTGMEVVVEQSTTCTLTSLNDNTATITIVGKISGATVGSASNVSFSGELQVDRKAGLIISFVGQQKEKRIPGPVSPGLNVTANIRWTQTIDRTRTSIPVTMNSQVPSARQQMLLLQTPLKLQIQHSREWHLFHETPTVLMMRQLREGSLISQFNLTTAVTVSPGDHTPDREFLTDVTETVAERKGKVISETTTRDDTAWRIRHVKAVGDASGDVILWDYYLCTAKTGEQFSIVFSHSKKDDELFGDEANQILESMQVVAPQNTPPVR